VKVIASTTGGPVETLDTVTLTAAEVVRFPAASRARAASVWAPLLTDPEFQVIADAGRGDV
jgi:hypothetical protein